MAAAHLVGGNVPEALVSHTQLDLRYDSLPNAMEASGCNMLWHSIDVVDLGSHSQRPVTSDQLMRGVGGNSRGLPLVDERERVQHAGSDVDSGLPHSGSSCFSDFSDSNGCCVTSDSEQEVRTSGACPKPVEFFVGLDSESDDDDDFFTACECSELSDNDSESDSVVLTEEEDDLDVTFSDDLCCSFETRPVLHRSQSWCAPEGNPHVVHIGSIPQCFSESNVSSLLEFQGNKEERVETPESKTCKRVHFKENPEIHCIVAWNFAYRAARKGPWEVMAMTRDRFKKRVEDLEPTFYHIFSKEHRGMVLARHSLVGTGDDCVHS